MAEFIPVGPFDIVIFGGFGDLVTLDATKGELNVGIVQQILEKRSSAPFKANRKLSGFGRDLFGIYRASCSSAERGGASFRSSGEE